MILAAFRLNLPLKKLLIGALLDLNEIRNVDAGPNTGKILPFDELL